MPPFKKISVYAVVWVKRPKPRWNRGLSTEINHLCVGPYTAESFAMPRVVWRWSTVTCALADAYFPSGLYGKLLAVLESSGLTSTRRGCSHFHLDPPLAKTQHIIWVLHRNKMCSVAPLWNHETTRYKNWYPLDSMQRSDGDWVQTLFKEGIEWTTIDYVGPFPLFCTYTAASLLFVLLFIILLSEEEMVT